MNNTVKVAATLAAMASIIPSFGQDLQSFVDAERPAVPKPKDPNSPKVAKAQAKRDRKAAKQRKEYGNRST